MYNSRNLENRLRMLIKRDGISVKEMISECELNENPFRELGETHDISAFNLAKIADCLDYSVDYLLGRTENPISHKAIIGSELADSEQLFMIVKLCEQLNVVDRAKLIVYIDQMF